MHSARFLFLCVILAGLGVFSTASCSRAGGANGHETANAGLPTVSVAKVTTADLSRGMVLTAEFKPFQEVDVMAKVAGYIKKINVDVGDRVQQGDLLATLEVPEMGDDLTHANASVARSNAEVERARDELRRAQSVHDLTHLSFQRLSAVAEKKPGLIAMQEIDDARSKDLVSEAQVSAAKSALEVANQQVDVNHSDVQKVRTLMLYTKVTAPFDGVVTKRYADTGSMIQAGTASQTQAMPVVRLSQNSMLRLILPVPESAVPTVRIGQQVQVRIPTLNRTFRGRVARFADKLAVATRTMDTEVDVANPSLVLIPGMYAQVDLTLNQRKAALAIPVNAVDLDPQGHTGVGTVMAVTPNNLLVLREIELGIETPNLVEVRSGLNEGDMVVLSGRASLKAGQEVRPKIAAATTAEVR
jgi:RND family efflux transporter MFP subunit